MSVEISGHYCRVFLQRSILRRDGEMLVRHRGKPNDALCRRVAPHAPLQEGVRIGAAIRTAVRRSGLRAAWGARPTPR